MPDKAVPTYARQLVKPFWRLMRRYPQFPGAAIDQLEAEAPERMPVADGQKLLQATVQATGEPNLGLLAANETEVGAFDVLEYVAFSAPTWRAALETALRYSRLLNEAAAFRLEIVGDKAQIILHSTVPLTRAGADFQSAAFYVAVKRWLDVLLLELEVHFAYPMPDDISQHRRTFDDRKLVFGAPWNGFTFDAERLSTKLASHAPGLHSVLRAHADALLAELAPGSGLPQRVRAHILSRLRDGGGRAEQAAAELQMTRRTLTRHLQQQGTSFRALVDEVRQRAATNYLQNTDHSVEDIAFLIGFSESPAFVRAFKRWTGMAPSAYRRSIARSRTA